MRDKLSVTFTFTYPLTARVTGAPQMTSQLVSSSFFSSFFLFSSALWDLESSQACQFSDVVFPPLFSLSLCLARLLRPDLMNVRLEHTTAVCVSLPWSGGFRVVQLPAGAGYPVIKNNNNNNDKSKRRKRRLETGRDGY